MNNQPAYQSPFGDLEAQLKQQLEQVQQQGRQYMQQIQQQYAPPAPGFDPAFRDSIRREIDIYDEERKAAGHNPMTKITDAIASVLSIDDQQLLAGNMELLPGYFQSEDGRSLLAMLVEGIKKQTITPPVAPQAGAARVVEGPEIGV